MYENLDQGNIILSLLLDFKKAFDCVDHVIILAKVLNYLNFPLTYHIENNLFQLMKIKSNNPWSTTRIHLGTFALFSFYK